MLATFFCAQCGARAQQATSAVNRAKRIDAPLYCNRECAGIGRRKHKTDAQKKAEKAAYDVEYRRKNLASIVARKSERHKQTYDPEAAAEARKLRMPFHIEYCRRPEYRAWKSEYDRQRRANEYGPFAEAYLLSIELNRTIKQKATNYEIRSQNDTHAKAQHRKRDAGIDRARS